MVERIAIFQNEILTKSLQLAHAKERRAEDIEEAKLHIPELTLKIHDFIDSKLPEDSKLRIPRKKTPEEIEASRKFLVDFQDGKVMPNHKSLALEFAEAMKEGREKPNAVVMNMIIPIDNEEVGVRVSRGLASGSYDNNFDLTIDVKNIPCVYKIHDKTSWIESKEHKYAEFTMHTPMGSNSDRGPKWKREWRTQDVKDISNLMEIFENNAIEMNIKQIKMQRFYP